MNPEDKSQIEELKKSLYSRTAPDIRTKRRLRFEKPNFDEVKPDWEHPPEETEDPVLNNRYKNNSMSFFTKLFIGSFIFFLCAVGIGTYLVLNGSNIVSANNIDITINGPISVAGGTPISFDIQVLNKNNIKLQNVDLSVDFPLGSVDPTDTTKELKQFRELMDDIEPGGVGQKTVGAIIYGEENSKKTITVTASYQVKGSNAIFQKQKTFDILLSSSPLSLSTNSYKEITSGQTFDTTVTITSNSKDTVKNLVLKGTYPSGFTFVSSSLKPLGDNSTWRIGDMPAGSKKIFTITGRLDGQDGETKVFHFSLGAGNQGGGQSTSVGTEFISAQQELAIQKPFVSVGISLAGDQNTQDYIGSFDAPIETSISYFNNLPTAIIDAEVHVTLSGNAFDKTMVNGEQGLYKSADNQIVWNKITNQELANIGAGESGKVNFSFTPHDLSTQFKNITNPTISITVDTQGKRISESNVPESISSSATRVVKISSNATLSSQIVRSTGPFVNTGTVPPRAEKDTTYTVFWTVDNTSNTLSGATVQASLPPYVKWAGNTSPAGEDITYNSNTGQITWRVGSVDTYTLASHHSRQVAFQITLNPSITQVGQIPTLVNQAVLTAQDDFTNQTLTSSQEVLTTRYSTDPVFKDGDEIVTK